jgi:hypothetical protein
MSEEKEANGSFKYDQDSKRFHRFRIESKEGIVGTFYIPKDTVVPDKVILVYAKEG